MDLLLAIKLITKSKRKPVVPSWHLLFTNLGRSYSILVYILIFLTVLIFQLFHGDQFYFSGSSTNKTDRHVITEILLTIALNKQTIHGLVQVIQ